MKYSIMSVNLKLSAFVAVCAALLAPGLAVAAEYTEGMDSITLTVSVDGDTNTLAEAIAAYNAANETDYTVDSFNGGALKDYALIKEGDGTLVMDTAIQSFTGPVVIKDGVVACMCQYALGADTTDSHVYVRDGATMWFNRIATADKKDTVINENRNYHVIGTGHNDQGAMNTIALKPNNSYTYDKLYGKTLSLDGNATVVHPAWSKMFSTVNLNGFTLTMKSPASYLSGKDWCNASFQAPTLNGPGKMVLDDSIYYFSGTTFNDTTEGNEIVVGENSGFRFWKSNYTGRNWTIRFTGENCWLWGDNNDGYLRFNIDGNKNGFYNAPRNRITNPMVLEGATLKMRTQSGIPDNWVFLTGPISGNGNINLECETWAKFPAGRLSLLNPENSFTGTATVDKGLLYVYEPGTLPSTVNLVVSRSHALAYGLQNANIVPEYFGVDFVSAQPQTLGPLTFTSVADNGTYHSGRIQGGSGTFSQIDKLSPNTMEYYSGIGSPLLNVEGGTVKLPRGPAPGLWEGTNKNDIAHESNPGSSWNAVFSSRRVGTNLVARGALLANCPMFPHFTAQFWAPTTYSGYIWNRTGQDQTVTLVSSMQTYVNLYIDDKSVLQQNTGSGAANAYDQVFTNLTLTTGPHKFEYRIYTGGHCISNNWDRMLGFAVDPLARGPSADTNNFMAVIDPGDGSLFTRSIDEADLPHFDEMRFAPGTTLDLNGNAYVAGTISGLPNVISSADDALAAPSLTITNRFVVNAADIANDPTLKITIDAIEFGANAGVTVTNLETLARGTYILAEATNSNEIVVADGFRQRCRLDSGKWDVRLSNDGKKLLLAPAPGFKISLR